MGRPRPPTWDPRRHCTKLHKTSKGPTKKDFQQTMSLLKAQLEQRNGKSRPQGNWRTKSTQLPQGSRTQPQRPQLEGNLTRPQGRWGTTSTQRPQLEGNLTRPQGTWGTPSTQRSRRDTESPQGSVSTLPDPPQSPQGSVCTLPDPPQSPQGSVSTLPDPPQSPQDSVPDETVSLQPAENHYRWDLAFYTPAWYKLKHGIQ